MLWTRQAALSADPGKVPVPGAGGLHLYRWNDRAVAGVAIAAFASGFGQFGVVAALGDVARGFGQVNQGATLADQAGLSGTDLGIGWPSCGWRRWARFPSLALPIASAAGGCCSSRSAQDWP